MIRSLQSSRYLPIGMATEARLRIFVYRRVDLARFGGESNRAGAGENPHAMSPRLPADGRQNFVERFAVIAQHQIPRRTLDQLAEAVGILYRDSFRLQSLVSQAYRGVKQDDRGRARPQAQREFRSQSEPEPRAQAHHSSFSGFSQRALLKPRWQWRARASSSTSPVAPFQK